MDVAFHNDHGRHSAIHDHPDGNYQAGKNEYSSADGKLRPTLFVGIGKTGTRVLRQIRSRLTERNGHRDNFSSINLFCVDTDSTELMLSRHTGSAGELTHSEVFPLPL